MLHCTLAKHTLDYHTPWVPESCDRACTYTFDVKLDHVVQHHLSITQQHVTAPQERWFFINIVLCNEKGHYLALVQNRLVHLSHPSHLNDWNKMHPFDCCLYRPGAK